MVAVQSGRLEAAEEETRLRVEALLLKLRSVKWSPLTKPIVSDVLCNQREPAYASVL